MSLKKLPIGFSSLKEIISADCVYIDKTDFVAKLNQGKYYFLSRPRRFGKSLLIDTLYHAFRGHREWFSGLALESQWNGLIKHPVVRFSFGGSSAYKSEETLTAIVRRTLKTTAERYEVRIEFSGVMGDDLVALVLGLYDKYQQKVVVLVDEYDKPILDVIDDAALAKQNREILKSLYGGLKDLDDKLKMVFITGLSKFSQVNLISGLNNLLDITLSKQYADICGYTQFELEVSFADRLEGVDKARLKRWYNGYHFNGTDEQKVYNPFDVLLFFSQDKQYRSYWFETATPSFLIKLLNKNHYYTPNLEAETVSESSLASFDVDSISLVNLALQSGYLTIKRSFERLGRTWYQLTYPNFEVKTSF